MRAAAILLSALALSALPSTAQASKCQLPSFEVALERADVVFVGRALRLVDQRDSVFAVERVYKGEVPRQIVLRFHGMKYSMLAPPGRFLVYGRMESSFERPGTIDLTAPHCSGSKLVADAADDLARLGAGRAPAKLLVSGSVDAGVATADAGATPDAKTPTPDADPAGTPDARTPDAGAPAASPAPSEPPGSGCAACAASGDSPAPGRAIAELGALLAGLFVRRVTGRGPRA